MASSSFNDNYKIIKPLDSGAQGTVYCVFDNRDQKKYAAKRISFSKITLDDIKKIEREAHILQQLNHPNIPQFHDFYTEQDQWGPATILITELINGTSLSQHLKTKKISEPQLQSIKDQTLETLTSAHSAGIIHRDIKPANLMLTNEGKVYVTDFGIAKHLDQETRLSSLGIGTLVYMSPEQLNGETLTPATDYYSLALTLIALASNQERSDDYRHQDPLKQLNKLTNLSTTFKKSLEQMLKIDPNKRIIKPSTEITSQSLYQKTFSSITPFLKREKNILKTYLNNIFDKCNKPISADHIMILMSTAVVTTVFFVPFANIVYNSNFVTSFLDNPNKNCVVGYIQEKDKLHPRYESSIVSIQEFKSLEKSKYIRSLVVESCWIAKK